MISRNLSKTLHRAFDITSKYKHEYVTLEHLLLALLDDEDVKDMLSRSSMSLIMLRKKLTKFLNSDIMQYVCCTEKPKPTIGFQRIVQRAQTQARNIGKDEINGINILIEMFSENDSYSTFFLYEQNITCMEMMQYVINGNFQTTRGRILDFKPLEPKEDISHSPALEEYCINLNTKAKNGKVDKLVIRDEIINRTAEILGKRSKNNVIYVGPPGVGKTAIVEGLALKIVNNEVPSLQNHVIYSIDMCSLLAGTRYRGDFEERIKIIMKEISNISNAIIFIDEIHVIIGAGSTNSGSIDASSLLKPFLTKGPLKCIGATTDVEYHSHFEKDAALNRRFQKIDVEEPSVEDSIKILMGIKSYYEKYHNVVYLNNAIASIVKLSKRYITTRMLPDKAIDIMDEIGARSKIKGKSSFITTKDVRFAISKSTGIPLSHLTHDGSAKLGNLSEYLKSKIFGQDEAIEKISKNVKIFSSGLRDETKPLGCYLFSGPTGVGKTQIAKEIAEFLHMKFIRFDMSEYMEPHSIAKIIGSPPGYIGYNKGGLLTDKVSKYPYSVVLFDEIEKAHKDVYNIMLQIMDYATLTDSVGKKIDFSNAIIIVTSNVCYGSFERDLGFVPKVDIKEESALNSVFTTEFRNRFDEVIVFKSISRAVISKLIKNYLSEMQNKLREKKIFLEYNDTIVDYLEKLCYSQEYGARYVKRVLDEKIRSQVADVLLMNKVKTLVIDIKNDAVCVV